MNTTRSNRKKPLWLTGEETCSLLALVVASPLAMGEVEERAMHKLGDLCRAFFREEADIATAARTPPRPRPSARAFRRPRLARKRPVVPA
jgi:hypothetical protein